MGGGIGGVPLNSHEKPNDFFACTAPEEVEVEVVPGPDLGPFVPGSARPGASKAGRVSGVANKAMTSRANKPTLEEQKLPAVFGGCYGGWGFW